MSQTAKPSVSVVILTHNEEKSLPECLQSLSRLNAEIFVVDSGSSDGTLGYARGKNITVVSHPFENYAAQRNWAQRNLPLKSEWLLHLDADERLTPELVEEINGTLVEPPDGVNGFLLRRRTIFLGRWIKHGGHYPALQLRLFRVSAGRCESRLYDQHFLVEGGVARLRNDFLDLIGTDLTSWTIRHAKWAELEAREVKEGSASSIGLLPARAFGDSRERKRWLKQKLYARLPLFCRPIAYWFYRYFVRLGFLDGKEGLVFHFLQGLWFRFLIDSKIYEKQRC